MHWNVISQKKKNILTFYSSYLFNKVAAFLHTKKKKMIPTKFWHSWFGNWWGVQLSVTADGNSSKMVCKQQSSLDVEDFDLLTLAWWNDE